MLLEIMSLKFTLYFTFNFVFMHGHGQEFKINLWYMYHVMIFLYQYIIASFFMFCFDIMAGGNCWPPFSIVWLYHSGATCLLLSARHRSSSTHQNLGTLDRNSRPRNKNGSSQSQRKYTWISSPNFLPWYSMPWCVQFSLNPDSREGGVNMPFCTNVLVFKSVQLVNLYFSTALNIYTNLFYQI